MKMWSYWRFFDFFSKMALTILMKLGQNVEQGSHKVWIVWIVWIFLGFSQKVWICLDLSGFCALFYFFVWICLEFWHMSRRLFFFINYIFCLVNNSNVSPKISSTKVKIFWKKSNWICSFWCIFRILRFKSMMKIFWEKMKSFFFLQSFLHYFL